MRLDRSGDIGEAEGIDRPSGSTGFARDHQAVDQSDGEGAAAQVPPGQ